MISDHSDKEWEFFVRLLIFDLQSLLRLIPTANAPSILVYRVVLVTPIAREIWWAKF